MFYGYATKQLNEYGLLDLSEVTFSGHPDALREIAAFLSEMAQSIESGALAPGSHRHLKSVNRTWADRFPGRDIIIDVPGFPDKHVGFVEE